MMHSPSHPGGFIKRVCLEPLGLSVTEAAKHLGVTRNTLSRLINEQAGISADMAVRLAAAFGSSPEVWLKQQAQYDLAQARKRMKKLKIKRIEQKEEATV